MWDKIKKFGNPIVIYGMGNGADKIISELNKRGMEISGIFANDDFVRGQTFHGFEVLTYDRMKEKYSNMTVLLSFGTHIPSVIERIKYIASEQNFFAPDVPVVGKGIFDKDYASIWKEQIKKARDILSDEESKRVFDEIIEYKLSGDITHLFKVETPDEENWKLLKLGKHENYLDIGAYNGDTVKQFISYVKDYDSITAMEPEKHSFKKLCENTKDLKSVKLLNMAINDKYEEGYISSGKGRGSSLGKGDPVILESVDDIAKDIPFSFIKIDAEGMEAKAIDGAKKTIEEAHPKMLIAAYHRTEDIFDIPLRVNKIYNGYRIYLRKTPCLPAWEVNYYFSED